MQTITISGKAVQEGRFLLPSLELELNGHRVLVTKGKVLSLAVRGMFTNTRPKTKEQIKALDSLRKATLTYCYEMEEWLDEIAKNGKLDGIKKISL